MHYWVQAVTKDFDVVSTTEGVSKIWIRSTQSKMIC